HFSQRATLRFVSGTLPTKHFPSLKPFKHPPPPRDFPGGPHAVLKKLSHVLALAVMRCNRQSNASIANLGRGTLAVLWHGPGRRDSQFPTGSDSVRQLS